MTPEQAVRLRYPNAQIVGCLELLAYHWFLILLDPSLGPFVLGGGYDEASAWRNAEIHLVPQISPTEGSI